MATGATPTRTSETTSPHINYEIPALAYGLKVLTQGWRINSILKFQNGEPVNVLSGQDNSGTGENEDRPRITGPAINGDRSVQQHTDARYRNPSSFALPGLGAYDNVGRNQVIGPGFEDVDPSLLKNTPSARSSSMRSSAGECLKRRRWFLISGHQRCGRLHTS